MWLLDPKLFQKLSIKVTNTPKDPQAWQISKERLGITPSMIFYFFRLIDPFKKDNEQQQTFFQDLALFIIKNYLLTWIAKNI